MRDFQSLEMPRPGLLGLAPMEGVTELGTRLWFAVASRPDFATTPFLRVTEAYPYKRVPSTFFPEMSVLKGTTPMRVVPQLMASDASELARIAEAFLKTTPSVDVNCGCPAPTVVGHGAGSGLLVSEEVFAGFVMHLASHLGAERVSVKMRTGFSDSGRFDALLSCIASLPLSRLTVHGRTRADRYLGHANWDLIARAADTVRAPVTGSGDITCHASYVARAAQAPGCASVIIGRGALRNPWVFEEIRAGGRRARLSFQALKEALTCFVLLQDGCEHQSAVIFNLAQQGVFQSFAGTDADAWQRLRTRMAEALGRSDGPGILEPTRAGLAKLKMLWNSMRSSLPAPFFSPGPLRASTLSGFMEALECCRNSWSSGEGLQAGSEELVDGQFLEMRYNPDYDWVYSGARAPRPEKGDIEQKGETRDIPSSTKVSEPVRT